MKIPFTNKELRLFSITQMDNALDQLINGRPSATGVNVNQNTALNCIPYFAGVRLISETCGQLPLIEYKRLKPRGKERATDRRLYYLLHDQPNPEMDAMSFKTTLTAHCVTWGNAFAEIQWDEEGVPQALWPLSPDRMQVGRDKITRKLIYSYKLPDGETVIIPEYRVFHLAGFGYDGVIGYDSVYLAREAIGMSLAMEEFGARFFGNGANPGGVLQHPNKLSGPAQDNLRKSWNEMHQGLSNQHRIAILEEGMEYKQVGIPPENAQFLESRKFQITEIARLLNIPPHMLKDLERATFSNIEHQGIEFVTHTMTPWFTRWEQTCSRKLLMPFERPYYFIEFLVDALLRGDSQARAAFYKELFYMGALSPNDIREKENMNPITDEGADKYYVQQNMIPMEMAGKQQQQQPKADLDETVKKIADRDKQNVIRAYRRDPHNFETWYEDYSRDFPEYMKKQLSSTNNNGHTEVNNDSGN